MPYPTTFLMCQQGLYWAYKLHSELLLMYFAYLKLYLMLLMQLKVRSYSQHLVIILTRFMQIILKAIHEFKHQ